MTSVLTLHCNTLVRRTYRTSSSSSLHLKRYSTTSTAIPRLQNRTFHRTELYLPTSITTSPTSRFYHATAPCQNIFSSLVSSIRQVIKPKEAEAEDAVKEGQQSISSEDRAQLEKSLNEGKFDFSDYRIYLGSATKMGGVLRHLPGLKKFRENIDVSKENMTEMQGYVKMLNAMTEEELKNPDLLMHRAFKAKQRLAEASGTSLHEVNRMLENFKGMQLVMLTVSRMKKEGKEIPSSSEGLMEMLQQDPDFVKMRKRVKR